MGRRDDIEREILATSDDFHRLLADVPDGVLDAPSDNPAWTVREVLFHMSVAPRMMVADVGLIMRRPVIIRVLPRLVPQALFDWVNKVSTRERGRRKDRTALAASYDSATATILRTLSTVDEADLDRSATYPGWDPLLAGEVTLERLFHYVRAHFDAHEAQIRERIPPHGARSA